MEKSIGYKMGKPIKGGCCIKQGRVIKSVRTPTCMAYVVRVTSLRMVLLQMNHGMPVVHRQQDFWAE